MSVSTRPFRARFGLLPCWLEASYGPCRRFFLATAEVGCLESSSFALRLRLLFNLVVAMSRFNSQACVRVLSVCCCLVAASGSESIVFAMCRSVVVF